MRYRGANIRLLKEPALSDVREVLMRLRAAGANALAMNTYHYLYLDGASLTTTPSGWYPRGLIYPDIKQDPRYPFGETVSVERVYAYAQMARDLGFERIVLKPMLDSQYGSWRGFVSIPVGLRRQLLREYKSLLLDPYIPTVKALDLDLCIGTEMYTLSKECGPEFWISVAKWLRWKGVRQPLTYAANWGWELDSEYNRLSALWPYLDYVGVDAYWPMVNEGYSGALTKEMLLSGQGNMGWTRALPDANGEPQPWCPRIIDDLERVMAETGKPLWFTEIGYPNNRHAALDPAGDRDPYAPITFELSRPLWEAARHVWDGRLEGWLTWEAGLGSVIASRSHNLLGTELEPLVWG